MSLVFLLALSVGLQFNDPNPLPGAINRFAINSLQRFNSLSDNQTNLVLSPLSMSTALSMLIAGAADHTREELLNYTGFKDIDLYRNLDNEFLKLLIKLNYNISVANDPNTEYTHRDNDASVNENDISEDDKLSQDPPFLLNIANRMYIKDYVNVSLDYMNVINMCYSSEVVGIPDGASSQDIALDVNEWIRNSTENRIKELSNGYDEETEMMIMNAVYLKAKWLKPFETVEEPKVFYNYDGSRAMVEYMSLKTLLNYEHMGDYQMFRLEYHNQASMIIVRPHPRKWTKVFNNLNSTEILAIAKKLPKINVVITMPMFQVSTNIDLLNDMVDSGVSSLLNDSNFSGITKSRDLQLTSAQHTAFISVTETGTEAAAISSFGLKSRSLSINIKISTPFIYLIEKDNIILFAGVLKHFKKNKI